MEFCEQCGAMLNGGENYCPKCGKKINNNIENDHNKNEEDNPYAPPQQDVPDFEVKKNGWQYFITVFKKYAVFKGRARRAEYWWFILFNFIFGFVISILDLVLKLDILPNGRGLIGSLWNLAVLIPSLSLTARRMHDCNKSGWFMLIPIYNIILTFTRGTYGPNNYGPDPITDKSEEES